MEYQELGGNNTEGFQVSAFSELGGLGLGNFLSQPTRNAQFLPALSYGSKA